MGSATPDTTNEAPERVPTGLELTALDAFFREEIEARRRRPGEDTRADTHHHAFGGGRHLCLGAHLARMEAQEAFAAMLDRFRRVAPAARGHRYAAIPSFRGLKELWLELDA